MPKKTEAKPHAISIYGSAKKFIRISGYERRITKPVIYYSKKARQWIEYRRTVKTIKIKSYIKTTKSRATRFTLYGKPKQVAKAEKLIREKNLVPKKQYEDKLSAEKFMKQPKKYSEKGEWVEKEIVESPPEEK